MFLAWHPWHGSLGDLRAAGHVFPGVALEVELASGLDVRLVGHGGAGLAEDTIVTRFSQLVDLAELRSIPRRAPPKPWAEHEVEA